MLQVARTDGMRPEWGTVGEVEEPWGCRLYTKDAQEELLDLYYRAILQAAPTGIEAEFTRERLEEEYAIGCIACPINGWCGVVGINQGINANAWRGGVQRGGFTNRGGVTGVVAHAGFNGELTINQCIWYIG